MVKKKKKIFSDSRLNSIYKCYNFCFYFLLSVERMD